MRKLLILILSFFAWTLLVNGKILIVTTIVPLANITKAIAGDSAEIIPLIPPGVSPHIFSPTPQIIKKIDSADLFITNGAGLDFWAKKFVSEDKNLLNMSSYVPLIKGENGKGYNPHIWLSVSNVRIFATVIDSELCSLDPVDSVYYNRRKILFIKRLDSLDVAIKIRLASCKNRYIVLFHPSLAYFDREYNINEVAVIEKSPGKEPTPREIMKIIDKVRKYKIKVLFAEPQLNSKSVKVIASETGAKLDYIDPIGNLGEDYIIFLKNNFLKIERSFYE
ncbi:MAG: zinc ABC transporter solute-binding protein [Proteobacteria bacterium]|nr:zinc ABC transporter solute-binding protein [Pseudomonadota bacterium]